MVSPISSPNRRFCPASGSSISVKQCVAERVLETDCPMSCPFNPFNPEAPKAFDAIVGLGLAGASRWLERVVSPEEWARQLSAMDRRFGAERDLPLISYETQWSILRKALDGLDFPEVRTAFHDLEGGGLRNDARLVFSKLAQSEAILVQVIDAHEGRPYYRVKSVFDEEEYLYVDFGDQEPLEVGALMFGRFLVHRNYIYVIPGVFVGTADVLDQIVDEIEDYFGEQREMISEALLDSLPEIWNICAAIQDERDGLGEDALPETAGAAESADPCQVSFFLDAEKHDAVAALDRHPFFNRYEPGGIPFPSELDTETIFDVYVLPVSNPPVPQLEGEEDLGEGESDEDNVVRVGSVYIGREKMTITALNPVEMELLKALVFQIIALPQGE